LIDPDPGTVSFTLNVLSGGGLLVEQRPPRLTREFFNLKNLFIFVVFILALYQIFLVFDGYGLINLKRIWRNRTLPAIERDMLFYLGETGMEYFDFVAGHVPEGMTVVTPDIPGDLSRQSIWQFFLMPRTVRSCGCEEVLSDGYASESCQACLAQSNHYLPAVGEFPPAELVEGEKEFIPFRQGEYWYKGIYIPKGSPRDAGIPPIQAKYPAGISFGLDLAMTLLIFYAGVLLAYRIDPKFKVAELLSLGIPLGVGMMTLSVFIASWTGLRLSILLYTLILAGWIGFLWSTQRIQTGSWSILPGARDSLRAAVKGVRQQWGYWILALVVLSVFLLALTISVGRGYSLYDGMSHWATKGYGIALEGSVYAAEEWGGVGLAYPLNVHLFIAMFRLLDGDALPGSKMIFPLFFLSLVIGCYAFWRKFNVDKLLSLAGALFVISIPAVFYWSTLGWANLIMAVYLVTGCLWIIDGYYNDRETSLTVGGILMGFSSWTRAEGIGYALILILVIAVSYKMFTRRNPNIIKPLLPTFLIAVPYFIFSADAIWASHLGKAVRSYSGEIGGGGGISLGPLMLIAQVLFGHAFSPPRWGILLPFALVVLIVFLLKKSSWKSPPVLTLLATFLMAGASTISILYVRYFSRGDYLEFLHRVMDRHILPAGILLGVLAILLIGHMTRPAEDGSSGDLGSISG
jgi:hypothetical protein